MEVVFKEVMYMKDGKKDSGYIFLNSLNYKFLRGNIYAFLGDASDLVGRLLVMDKRPSKGTVVMDGNTISKTTKIDNLEEIRRNFRYIDFNNKFSFIKNTFEEEVKFLLKGTSRLDKVDFLIEKSLIMVGLDIQFKDRELFTLSNSETKKILLAVNLCLNPKVMVLKDFDKGLTYKDKEHFKRLLRKIKDKYNKLIVIISDDVNFLYNFVDKVLVFDEGIIIYDESKELLLDNKLYEFADVPKTIEFINHVNSKKNKDFELYLEPKEVLKAVFRDIDNKE